MLSTFKIKNFRFKLLNKILKIKRLNYLKNNFKIIKTKLFNYNKVKIYLFKKTIF